MTTDDDLAVRIGVPVGLIALWRTELGILAAMPSEDAPDPDPADLAERLGNIADAYPGTVSDAEPIDAWSQV